MKTRIALLLMFGLFAVQHIFAQGEAEVNKSFMSSDLKIYVVVAVLTIILTTIFVFLLFMEKRLRKLEEK